MKVPKSLRERPVRSVAAFLWMPQLHLSTRHMAHLSPVFVSILASAFASSGLLPRHHPAVLHGLAGAREYSAGDIISEAWFHLRTTRASINQWGIFASVMLMLALIIGSLATFVMTAVYGVGATAQAQIFSHPLGDSNFNAQGQYSPGSATADPFDKAIPAAGTAAGDFGIMMLDKAIRAGANGQGGPLQVATQKLMLTYNTGIMVIASAIIFWMIINIVVDTAKTGQVGGGRHNMVWLPIRIVFALALLIPLGSNGYSSGQYMVMKIAEWGSNFGSQAWAKYTEGVAQNTAMVVKGETPSMSDAVYKYTQMWICRTSVNAHKDLGSNSSDPGVVEERVVDTSAINGRRKITFTDYETDNLCGSLTYTVAGSFNAAEGLGRYFSEDQPIRQAMYNLKSSMETAYYVGLTNEDFTNRVKSVACRVVGGNTSFSGRPVLNCGNGDSAYIGTGIYPTVDEQPELEALIKTYESSVRAEYNRAFGQFEQDITSMADIMSVRGWAGMGLWYHRIAQLNSAAFGARNPANIITVGSMSSVEVSDSRIGRWWSGTQWAKDVKDDLTAYENWWRATPKNAVVKKGDALTPAKGGQRGVGRGDVSASSGGTSNADVIIAGMGIQDKNNWISLLDNDDPNVYPLATLASIGNSLFNTSMIILASVTGLQALGSIFSSLYDLNNWAIWPFLTQAALIPLAAGAMLKFYVPMIPFIRVLFSVLTWIISVFEAVVMVPIAALAHLSSQGEGLAPGAAEAAWKLWLNILLRPILTVIGFVGAMMVFNAFVTFVNGAFLYLGGALPDNNAAATGFFESIATAFIYTFVVYTTANTVFKMMDMIPEALGRWYGVPQGQSFDSNNESGALLAASNMVTRMSSPFKPKKPKGKDGDKNGPGLNPDGSDRDRNKG